MNYQSNCRTPCPVTMNEPLGHSTEHAYMVLLVSMHPPLIPTLIELLVSFSGIPWLTTLSTLKGCVERMPRSSDSYGSQLLMS